MSSAPRELHVKLPSPLAEFLGFFATLTNVEVTEAVGGACLSEHLGDYRLQVDLLPRAPTPSPTSCVHYQHVIEYGSYSIPTPKP